MEQVERGALPERYDVGAPAGRGGMGVVFRGHDRKLGREVALKFLAAGGGWDLQVALREARALAQVAHDGVMRVYDVFEGSEGAWIVMEWLQGRTLDALPRPPSLMELVALTLKLREALAAVHAAGLVHRDLKPSNVMLCTSGRVALIDFGVAYTQGLSSGFTLAGTPRYSAPWCFAGEAPGPDSDMFSLGMVILELLSGVAVVPDLAPIPLYRFLSKKLPGRVIELLDGEYPPLASFLAAVLNRDVAAAQAEMLAKSVRGLLPEPTAELLKGWACNEAPLAQPTPERLRDVALAQTGEFTPKMRAAWQSFLNRGELALHTAVPEGAAGPLPTKSLSTRFRREKRGREIWMALVAGVTLLVAGGAVWGRRQWAIPSGSVVLPTPRPVAAGAGAVAAVGTEIPMPTAPPAEPTPITSRREPLPVRRRTERPAALMTPRASVTPVSGRLCAVQFSANAWARLFVDSRFVMQLPSAKPVPLSVGRHLVRLENPMAETLTAEIQVPAAESERFHFNLNPALTPSPSSR